MLTNGVFEQTFCAKVYIFQLGEMDRFVNKIAVVTGASSGIGAAVSKEFVKHGLIVVGLARRNEKLKDLEAELSDAKQYPGKLHTLKCDVRNESEVKSSFKWIRENLGYISLLVNNAGVLITGSLIDVASDDITRTFDTNVKGALLCAKEALNSMVANSVQGHIININSVAGTYFLSLEPRIFYVYSSSKHALRVISEGLRQEIIQKGLNIKVTNLSPGHVITEMTDAAAGQFLKHNENKSLKPLDIANTCILVLSTPPNVLISELTITPIYQEV